MQTPLRGLLNGVSRSWRPRALGCPGMVPPRRPVDGTGVARGLDEGLNEQGPDVVVLSPVPGQAAPHDGGVGRAEIWDPDPGQDWKARGPVSGARLCRESSNCIRERAHDHDFTELLAPFSRILL